MKLEYYIPLRLSLRCVLCVSVWGREECFVRGVKPDDAARCRFVCNRSRIDPVHRLSSVHGQLVPHCALEGIYYTSRNILRVFNNCTYTHMHAYIPIWVMGMSVFVDFYTFKGGGRPFFVSSRDDVNICKSSLCYWVKKLGTCYWFALTVCGTKASAMCFVWLYWIIPLCEHLYTYIIYTYMIYVFYFLLQISS